MRSRLTMWAIGCVLIAACARRTPDSVARAFVSSEPLAESTASTVLFVPGIMGSELVNRATGDVVWGAFGSGTHNPNRDADALRAMALPVVTDDDATLAEDPEVEPGGQLLAVDLRLGALDLHARAYPGVFEGVIGTLESGGKHFQRLTMADAMAGRSPVYAVGYDWRRSVTAEAARLHQDVLAAVKARRDAGLDPHVDIVAHSLGTLLVRWYLRYGPTRMGPDGPVNRTPWDPSRYIRRVVLVAPPNLGEPSIFDKLAHGERPNPLVPAYGPAITMTFPSLYEMLPRPGAGRVVWHDTGEEVDLYDADLWRDHEWGAFHTRWDAQLSTLFPALPDREARLRALHHHVATQLSDARRVHVALDAHRTAPRVPVHVFVGTDHTTPGTLVVHRESGALTWVDPQEGDGTVTRRSALADGVRQWDSVHFINADHMGITASPAFLEDALFLLLDR